MGIFDRFKRKKPAPAKVVEAEKEKEVPKKKPPKKVKKEPPVLAYKVLKSPHITEKSSQLAKENQYTFVVFPKANKKEIEKAISELYGVDVEKVRIVKKPSKQRRIGRQIGKKPGYKKAIVKIKPGQKIDIFPLT